MKKVLEGELLSIAHRVLQMKSKDVNSLYNESKQLYEKLLILKFYNDKLEQGLIQDVSTEQIENALSIAQIELSEDNATVSDRQQMPGNLVEEDYPIVVDTHRDSIGSAIDHATKIDMPIEEDVFVSKDVFYDTPFQENAFEEEDDADRELIKLLEEHELATSENASFEVNVVSSQDEDTFVFAEVNVQDDVHTEETEIEELIANGDLVASESPLIEAEETNVFAVNEVVEPTIEDEISIAVAPEVVSTKIEDDPFFGFNFGEVEFVRVDDVAKEVAQDGINAFDMKEEVETPILAAQEEVVKTNYNGQESQNTLFNMESISANEVAQPKSKSINDIYNATIVVGLNDRIAFEKYLFEGSSEDFNRVLSQLNTVGSFEEATSFVEHLVKPEYNNWAGKDEYAERFMTIIEKRFI